MLNRNRNGLNKTINYSGKLPARVLQVFVADDENIQEGDPVCIVETPDGAVKIRAPESGSIQCAFCEAGLELTQNEILIMMNEKHGEPNDKEQGSSNSQ